MWGSPRRSRSDIVNSAELAAAVLPPEAGALVYVCGSTPFVEQVLRWLGELGHDVTEVRAERFGGA